MCSPQYQLSCNKPWAFHPTDNYILIGNHRIQMFNMVHSSVSTTVPLFRCIYAHHSIQPSSDSHGHSSVSTIVLLSHSIYAHHSILLSSDSHGYSSVSITVLSLCIILCSPQHPAIKRQPWTLLCKYHRPFISLYYFMPTTASCHQTTATDTPL